jgi:hypothetical protein
MEVLKGKNRSFRVRHNPRKAKSHRVYSDADVRALYDVCRNTIRNWIKVGLRPIDGLPPRLFTGAELNRFHADRAAAARRKPVDSEIYCIACGSQQAMSGRTVRLSSVSGVAGYLHWTCPGCGGDANILVGPETLRRLASHGVLIHRMTEATN